MKHLHSTTEFEAWQAGLAAGWDESRPVLRVCDGTGCRALGSRRVLASLREEIDRARLDTVIQVVGTGCPGFCECGPLITIYPQRLSYQKVSPADVPEIVHKTLVTGETIERLLYTDPQTGQHIHTEPDLPFYQKQKRLVLGMNGRIDPTRIQDYVALGGYTALAKALALRPEDIIVELKAAGLRGRGGAGFPTGLKWELCRKNVQAAGAGYIICNADEGDPGAFMDRSIVEGNPHSVIEGMVVGAYAIGARQGYVYIRAEYPLAIENLQIAIQQAGQAGLLGQNILGSSLDFSLNVRLGAGAFVCGEETALMASIEGRIGEPRPRPPYPAESGLWGKPTNINNVETWATVPIIVRQGSQAYAAIGTARSKGTKIFSLVGKINNTGLVEVPMGVTLREVIYDIGGGIPKGKRFKAVQLGGPSGGCIPAEHLDTPIDYEALTALGAIMGSGGMVVTDEDTCMVDLARYFLKFVQEESCGKCVPCRLGTKAMLATLERICEGEGRPGDVEYLVELGEEIKRSSLCGLGQTAPNAVLSTIRYFRHEYDAHIYDKHCAAGACRSLVRARCVNACPAGVDVPSWVALAAQGRYAEAVEIHRQANPFVLACSRVCPAFCERHCRRGDVDAPVAIRHAKRLLADYQAQHPWTPPRPEEARPERVAVVGGGPVGLTAALRLAQKGYPVTVLEKLPVLGGMMAVGIPAYRLPRELLQQEIEGILRAGIEVKTGTALGRDFSVDSLLAEGYRAVILAIGAHKSRPLNVEGEDKPGVYPGVAFLRQVALGNPPDLAGKVVGVVGGGDVAIDAARTAWRLGAKEVRLVYRREREQMPAYREEVEAAQAEGILFHFLTAPLQVTGDGRVQGLECQRQVLGEFDSSGRRRSVPEPGSQFVLDLDVLIPAIGQEVDLEGGDGLEMSPGGALVVDESFATTRPAVFAAGDAAGVAGGGSQPATVIHAVAQGNQLAGAVDRYLRTGRVERGKSRPVYEAVEQKFQLEAYAGLGRLAVPVIPLDERRNSFAEVERSAGELAIQEECRRCLRCDLEWLETKKDF
ncbi:MAG: FAD-dependent oxidoreductase [Thermoflexales bacterium]|nr:FAD-dependent oxidoreductase [Thermoflexales bacterium]